MGIRTVEAYRENLAKFSTEDRLRMIHLVQRMLCSHEASVHEVTTVHGEGSTATQMMMIMAESPFKQCKLMARAAPGIG